MSEERIEPDDSIEEEFLGDEELGEELVEPDESELDVLDDDGGEPEEQAAPPRKQEVDAEQLQRLRNEEAARQLQYQMALDQQRAREEFYRVQSMSPDEQERYFAERTRQQAIRHIQHLQDQADAAAFAKFARQRGLSKRRVDAVEATMAQARQQGWMGLSRQQALSFVIGQEVLQKRNAQSADERPAPSARRRGQSRQDAEDERLLRSITLGQANGGRW